MYIIATDVIILVANVKHFLNSSILYITGYQHFFLPSFSGYFCGLLEGNIKKLGRGDASHSVLLLEWIRGVDFQRYINYLASYNILPFLCMHDIYIHIIIEKKKLIVELLLSIKIPLFSQIIYIC